MLAAKQGRLPFGTASAASIVLFLAACAAPTFDLQGHRGARGLAPENTLPAFAGALSRRCLPDPSLRSRMTSAVSYCFSSIFPIFFTTTASRFASLSQNFWKSGASR